jgi:hypothetical protein
VANNVPAFEFNTDGTYRGLLVEPGATNLWLNSSPSATPGTGSVTAVTFAVNDWNLGSLFGGKAIFGDNSTSRFYFNASVLATTQYAFSFFIKPDNGAQPTFGSGGTDIGRAVVSGSSIGSGYTITPTSAAGIFRVQVSATSGASSLNSNGIQKATGNNSVGFEVTGFQLETGSVATSPIVTTAGTASRVADAITLTGASSLIGQTEGTLYAEVVLKKNTTGALVSINDGTGTNRLFIQFFSATQLLADIRVGGANHNYTATIPAVPASGGTFKVALAYKQDDFCFALNGTTYASTASRSIPATTQVDLANHLGAVQLNDNVRSVALFPTRLANATLQSLTS